MVVFVFGAVHQGDDGLFRLVDFLEVVDGEFGSGSLIGFPAVDLDGRVEVGEADDFVVFLEIGLIDAGNGEFTCADIIVDEIGVDALSGMQLEFVGHQFGDEDLLLRGCSAEGGNGAFYQVLVDEGGIELFVDALEHHAEEIVFRLQDALRHGEPLDVLHSVDLPEQVHHRVVHADRILIDAVDGGELGYRDMTAETDGLVADGMLETEHHADTDNHDRQSDGYPDGCNTYGRTTHFLLVARIIIDTLCYKEGKVQGFCVLLQFCPARIALERFLEDEECTGEVFLLQHVGDTHLIDACSRSGIETAGRSHHHRFALVAELFQTPAAEFLTIVDGELGYRVEGTHRNRGIDARNAVESVDEAFTALHVFVIHFAEVFFRCVERCLGHDLSDEWGREAGLAEFHHGLADLLVLRNQGTDSDAALAIALRYGVDEHHVLLDAFQVAGGDIG